MRLGVVVTLLEVLAVVYWMVAISFFSVRSWTRRDEASNGGTLDGGGEGDCERKEKDKLVKAHQ